jgi:hypothetical protein
MAPPASLKDLLDQSRKIDRAPQAPEPAFLQANAVTGGKAARTIGGDSRAACDQASRAKPIARIGWTQPLAGWSAGRASSPARSGREARRRGDSQPLRLRDGDDGSADSAYNRGSHEADREGEMLGQEDLRRRLEELRSEHRDLDDVIARMSETAPFNQLQLQRLKKRKLALKDQITQLESKLLPDIIA